MRTLAGLPIGPFSERKATITGRQSGTDQACRGQNHASQNHEFHTRDSVTIHGCYLSDVDAGEFEMAFNGDVPSSWRRLAPAVPRVGSRNSLLVGVL